MARFVLLLLFLLLTTLASKSLSTSKLIRAKLKHIDDTGSFTKTELLQRAAHRSKLRRMILTGKSLVAETGSGSSVQVPVHAGTAEFLMELGIGTPTVTFDAIVDTGSDLVWTQCESCDGCPPSVYNPSESSTFINTVPCTDPLCKSLPPVDCSPSCTYNYTYGDRSSTFGPLGIETITFQDSASIEGITFGCSSFTQGGWDLSNGLVGLGKGPLSLITQLGSRPFSYCFTEFSESNESPLLIGDLSLANGQSTPIIPNPIFPSFYYLSLTGITVGSTLLPIPTNMFAINDDGTGGLIIDSGTSITSLEDAGYQLLKQEFQNQVALSVADGSSVGLDLCFVLPSDSSTVTVPILIFHFDGADMKLPVGNYFTETDSGQLCLTILSGSGMSIFGNHQQQNFQVVYDTGAATLCFAETQCDKV